MNLDAHWHRLRGEDRKQAMASLLALTRAVPQLRLYPLIREWTLPEARRWVALMKEDTPSLTAARRAAALLDLSRRCLPGTALACAVN